MISATPAARPRSASPKVWRLLPHDPAAIRSLSAAAGVSPIVAQLLLNRKISDPQLAKKFLGCSLSGMHDPELLSGLNAAIDRILPPYQSVESALRDG